MVGINYDPHLTTTDYRPGDPPGGRPPRRDDWTTGLEELLRAFAGRYGRPLMVTETSVLGDVPRRLAWLDASLELVADLREQGVEIVLEADEIGTLHRRVTPVADRFRF